MPGWVRLDGSPHYREEIRLHYGYRHFNDQPEHFRLVWWLGTRAWLSAERPSGRFDLATAKRLSTGFGVLRHMSALMAW